MVSFSPFYILYLFLDITFKKERMKELFGIIKVKCKAVPVTGHGGL
jgi:hypothetical protein